MFGPIFNRNCSEMNINCVSIDIEQDQETAARYSVNALPTTIIVDDAGNEIDRRIWVLDDAAFQQFILSYSSNG